MAHVGRLVIGRGWIRPARGRAHSVFPCPNPRTSGLRVQTCKAALIAANFSISKEAQTFLAKFGRLPTRADVETNPPGVLKALDGKKIVTVLLNTEEDRRRIRQFNDIFKPR